MATRPLNILIVDDEPTIRKMLSISLTTDGHFTTAVATPTAALAETAQHPFDLAMVDLRLGTEKGMDLVPKLVSANPWLKVIVITAFASIDTAVEAIKRGAADYLAKPFTPAQVRLVVDRAAEVLSLERRVADLQSAAGDADPAIDLESANPETRRSIELARQVATSDATVLIRGESGTGKGVIARAIHGWSDRARGPFATVSCPTLSPQLLESELFGHVKGAFTGALRTIRDASPVAREARCFSMKSGIFRSRCNPSFFVSFRIGSMSGLATG